MTGGTPYRTDTPPEQSQHGGGLADIANLVALEALRKRGTFEGTSARAAGAGADREERTPTPRSWKEVSQARLGQ